MTYSKQSFVQVGKEIGGGIGVTFGALLGLFITSEQINQKTQKTTVTTTKISTECKGDNLQIRIQEDNKELSPIKLPGRECQNTSDIKITKDGNTTIVQNTVTEEKPVIVTSQEACNNLKGGMWLGYHIGAGVGYAAGYIVYGGVVCVDYAVIKPCYKLLGSSKKVELITRAEDVVVNIENAGSGTNSLILTEDGHIPNHELTSIGDSDEA